MLSNEELVKVVREDVQKLSDQIGIVADILVTVETDEVGHYPVISIEYQGSELGYMIGSRGQHLKSLQYILSLSIRKKYCASDDERIFVNVDVGGYKKEIESKIEQIALQKAEDAKILGSAVDLEPMSPGDRRIVHTVLSKFDDIKTESFGEGIDRAVRIIPISGSSSDVKVENDPTEEDLI